MASLRKSSTKTRAALAASTAIPIVSADVIEHAGEQAAKLTIAAADPDPSGAPDLEPALALVEPEAAPHAVAAIFEAAVHDVIEQAAAPVEPAAAPVESPEAPIEPTAAPVEWSAEVIEPMARPAEAVVEHVITPVAQAGTELASTAIEMVEAVLERSENAGRALIVASTPQSGPPTDLAEEIRIKVADAVRANIEDAVAYWAALMSVRSVPEAISLNAHHLHRRVEAFASQSRDIAMLVQKVASDAMERFRPSSAP